MTPRIELLPSTKIIGFHRSMSMAQNTTFELWQPLMKRRGEISNTVSADLISLQIYPPDFNPADMNRMFVKWAGVPVSDFEKIPDGMSGFEIPQGQYAVFDHIGGPPTAAHTFGFIFGQWLPQSNYALDDRPHFEVLGERYKHGDPKSEEEIWIPIKKLGDSLYLP